ncbi:hypothetical protein [Ktedonospora formicarum]|uniref:Uncharacterized protein n=1 Tax=Ktedonospora formicarum TaxID=2778364 RepID=A0A8J3MRA2_9CHLR|nr:hypothetical protein [Ktedonospora formicarum]GHO45762.1 hypothetical protein KSX_39250 [Ktedonospora formicarum]
MDDNIPPFLNQSEFDALFTWLQEQCKTRYTLSGFRYTYAKTFEHTRRWLEANAYLTHLLSHHTSKTKKYAANLASFINLRSTHHSANA